MTLSKWSEKYGNVLSDSIILHYMLEKNEIKIAPWSSKVIEAMNKEQQNKVPST